MAYQDLKAFFKELEKADGELIRIKEELSPCLELLAVLKRVGSEGGGPAVLFEKIKGYEGFSVTGNVLGTTKRLAIAMGVPGEKVYEEYLKRRENLIPPKTVRTGPVKEVIIKKGIDLLAQLPSVVHHQKDSGAYLSAGILIGKDPETGVRSMGIHRLEIKGKNRMGVLLHSAPLSEYFAKAESKGKAWDCAVAVGVEPTILSASVAKGGLGTDKLAMAGGLRGEAVKQVRCETVDVMVPAYAEVIIEGRVLPKVREKEGPFGESTGYYLTYNSPVIEVTAITRRKNPIFEIIEPWGPEGEVLMYIGYGTEMFRQLKQLAPNVVGFHLVPGTCSSHAVIQVNERGRAEARRILHMALSTFFNLKKVTVVDTDVDIYNLQEVEWAAATRFQADKDLVVVTDVPGLGIDPSTKEGGFTAKIGIDATVPAGEPDKFEKISVGAAADKKAREILRKYLPA